MPRSCRLYRVARRVLGVLVAVQLSAGAAMAAVHIADAAKAGDRETVFDRFVRLEPSRSTPGNGLGLSLVRAVARRHAASVTLADNHPGLRVRIEFPAWSPAA